MDNNKSNNGQNASNVSNASNQGKADDGYVEKEFIVLDQNKTRYVTARGILWANHVPQNEHNLHEARVIMKKIAQKYASSKYPVMSNKDVSRAEYQGMVDAKNENAQITNKDDLDRFSEKYRYEQNHHKKYVDKKKILDIKNIDEETNVKIQEALRKEKHRKPTIDEVKDAIHKVLNERLAEAQEEAPAVFFPKTRERGIREDVFINEMILNNENLFHEIHANTKNGQTVTPKFKNKYDYKDDNGFEPNFDIKNDPGIQIFKNMLIHNHIQPSSAKDLLREFYVTYNSKNKEIDNLKKQLDTLRKSVIVRKNVPYDRPFFDDKHPYNPFLSGKELKKANKKVESEQKDHPYVFENEAEYQDFQDWLKKDPNNQPILKQIKKGKTSKNTTNKTSNNNAGNNNGNNPSDDDHQDDTPDDHNDKKPKK